MPKYFDADEILKNLPDDLPYKASVKRVLIQAPTADVVPESEAENLKALFEIQETAYEGLKKLYRMDTDALVDARRKTEVEVAREIFAEIEAEIKEALESNYRARPHIAESEELYHIVDGKITALSGMQDFIAELKKKYTEEIN